MNYSSATQKICELMSNVIVYVEVRTGEDNRSEGVKKVISNLGAKVHNRLTKNTTHVIFKDGLLSTYKRAKQLNIPLVSILWVEACKKNCKLMDPLLFPISNIDRYEFPEMYDKFKRIKSMQPDAIDNKRRKNNSKQVDSPRSDSIKLPRIPRTPKDNLNHILTEFQDKIMSTPDNDESIIFQSKLLQKIQSSPFTPKNLTVSSKRFEKSYKIAKEIVSGCDGNILNDISTLTRERYAEESVSCAIEKKVEKSNEKIRNQRNRRKTIASTPNQINNKNDISTKNLSSYFSAVKDKHALVNKSNRKNGEIYGKDENKSREIYEKDQNGNNINVQSVSKPGADILNENIECGNATPVERTENLINRRTLYTPQNMEISIKFDSTKKPSNNRRKTLFDMSLDIIDKGLKNINEQLKTNKTISSECTINDQTNGKITDDSANISCTPTGNSNTTPIIKKRKLFMPDQFELTPVAEINKTLLLSEKRIRECEILHNPKNINKKRRTTINSLTPAFNKENRRSSFDFEKLPKCQLAPTTKILKPKAANILVCTNVHKDQLEFIQRVVKSLGNFEIETQVTERTTHVVSPECRRTINIIKGIIRGLWILKYEWVVESFNKSKWLHEEPYELREFSRSVEVCRSERQAFGPTYRMELFAELATVYVSNKCKVPVDSLKEIIRLCSGRLVTDPKECKYVIGDYCEGKICLEPQWILDCITNNKMMKFFKYAIKPVN